MKVFISHSSVDKKFVRTLKSGLNENSIETWFDEDQLDFGDSLAEKLELALEESTHFIIVLSASSVKSNWVIFELEKAMSEFNKGLMQKIIPIKYRDCSIPNTLSTLLYGDLSKEVVIPQGDEVKFISSGYEKFFLQLVNGIKSPNVALTKSDKDKFKKSFESTEEELNKHYNLIRRGIHKVIGFSNKESRIRYEEKVKQNENARILNNTVRPILLPASVKHIWNPKIGEKIDIDGENLWYDGTAHFAGFRSDDISITVDGRIRKIIDLRVGNYYEVEILPSKKMVKFHRRIN